MAFDNLQQKLTKTFRNLQGKGKLSERNMEETLKEIRLALLESDVNYKVVKDLLVNIKEKSIGQDVYNAVEPGQLLIKIVNDEITNLLGSTNSSINYKDNGITTIMFVGLQGTGKTTNLAKAANLVKTKQNRKVLIIAADLQRPAAIDQLKTLGNSIDIEVFSKGQSISALETVKQGYEYAKTKDIDTIFIDTAGRLAIDEVLMDELKQIKDFVKPDDILLTVDAMTGQDIVNVAQKFNDLLNVTGLVVTKFDGDSKGGGILSVKSITNVAVKFVGVGEKITDIDIFYPDRTANRILGMGDVVSLVEQVQDTIDEETALKQAQKMFDGTFTLDDMLAQLDQVNKLGPISSILNMMPGMSDLSGQINDEDAKNQMKKTKAIIQSMTQQEKQDPSYLRNSHKRRIASGSGTNINDVNKLINQFEKMKKTMKQLGTLKQGGKNIFSDMFK